MRTRSELHTQCSSLPVPQVGCADRWVTGSSRRVGGTTGNGRREQSRAPATGAGAARSVPAPVRAADPDPLITTCGKE